MLPMSRYRLQQSTKQLCRLEHLIPYENIALDDHNLRITTRTHITSNIHHSKQIDSQLNRNH